MLGDSGRSAVGSLTAGDHWLPATGYRLLRKEGPWQSSMPVTVALRIEHTDPGLRGDTATGGSKPATLETGLVVSVPLFLNEGDLIKVDTRTAQYLERVTG